MELQNVMNVMPASILPHPTSYRHLRTRFEPQYGALWCYLAPNARPCFSFEVLAELRRFQEKVERSAKDEGKGWGVRYIILASVTPGVFNFGGDLRLFIRCLKGNDPETLRRYAKECIDVLYTHAIGFHLPITTISLVQGDALGGGFEAALASDILVSEKQAQFGFPEVLFNLFPGMGAFNLLERRIGMQRTERMLLNGKLHRAADLHAEGIVDILAENGRGENAVYEHIVRQAGRQNAQQAVLQVRRKLRPLLYEELMEVKEIWVDTAMRLGPREIRLMERLVNAQTRVSAVAPASIIPPRTENA
ncbi:MAG TPA: crotonase/enoyl-CoA hydratase family protein [Candidatus Deferrimicrobium sp.]|nr:crotonase/enoyl-CoA hydratase family protein [Candidatus Deferrimicrobium sp.]